MTVGRIPQEAILAFHAHSRLSFSISMTNELRPFSTTPFALAWRSSLPSHVRQTLGLGYNPIGSFVFLWRWRADPRSAARVLRRISLHTAMLLYKPYSFCSPHSFPPFVLFVAQLNGGRVFLCVDTGHLDLQQGGPHHSRRSSRLSCRHSLSLHIPHRERTSQHQFIKEPNPSPRMPSASRDP